VHPVLLQIGPLTVHSYGVMLALGAGLGLILLGRLARSAGLDPERMSSLALWVLLSALLGSRLVYVLMEPGPFLAAPWRILFIWEGGLVFYGGVAAGLVVGLALARRWSFSLPAMLDCFGPALALGQAFGRVGCFLAGCCYGLPWEQGWCAVTFTARGTLAPPGLPVHPTQLYSALALMAITGATLLVWRRWKGTGMVFCLYGLLHGAARLVIEQFRGDYRGEPLLWGLAPTALFALALALACGAGLVYLAGRRGGKEA
jgi:phosphatidylglycerol:prolipoprotein diacylglycerol transferase